MGEDLRRGAGHWGRWRRLVLACALVAATLVASAAALGAPADTVWTLAGTGVAADSGDGGQAREGAINLPRSVSATSGGYVWAEPWSHRVRIVDANGIVTTLAGTGTAGFSGDGGAATAAKLNFVHTAAPTADGGYLLADTLNNRIRKISSSGLITTVAGTGAAGYAGDGGPATAAQINNPRNVVALPDGGFLIPDSNNHRVRKVSAAGVIMTVAGTGTKGFSGDGGAAVAAQLSIPFDVAPTADGGFLIVDVGNQRIRKVSAAGTISTVAGNGVAGFGGDGGPATAASVWNPHDVVATADGGFLIADSSNERVRRVGADGVIGTLIGDGVRGYTGDGSPASAARVSVPKGVALTAAGDVLIAEEQNNRIRFVGTPVAPANTAPPAITGSPAQGQQLVATAGGWSGTGPLISYQWQRCDPACANVTGAAGKTYTVGSADAGARLRVTVTASNPAGAATAASPETAAVPGASAPPSNPSPPPPPPAAASPPPPPPAADTSNTAATSAAASPVSTQAPAAVVDRQPAPAASAAPPKVVVSWLVRAGTAYNRAGEYTIRGRTSRLRDAIGAYGAPSRCRVVASRRVVATWAGRGIRIDGRIAGTMASRASGCSRGLAYVSAIRLSEPRWTTALGLRVGDAATKLRRLYPKARFVPNSASRRDQYYLVWRRGPCTASCTAAQKRLGVDMPRLVAEVERGRVIAFRLPVLEQRG